MVDLDKIYEILGLQDHQNSRKVLGLKITSINTPALSSLSEIAICIESYYLDQIEDTQAQVILTTPILAPKISLIRSDIHLIIADDGRQALFQLIRFFGGLIDLKGASLGQAASLGQGSIHPTAVIAQTSYIHPTAIIGPFCVIDDHCEIGEGCYLQASVYLSKAVQLKSFVHIYPHAYLGERTEIGHHVVIGPNAIVGMHGFGLDAKGRLPHLGKTVIGDHSEISGLTAIDRATLGVTSIGKGVQIDHLVQIAHNVKIEDHVVLCAQVGISGGAVIKNGCVLGGQVGVNNRVEIGEYAQITAKTGVTKDLKGGTVYAGYPAEENKSYLKRLAQMKRFFSKNSD